MVKIRCVSLDGGAIYANQYTGPSGKDYTFHRGSTTEIKNRGDAESFLKSQNGTAFKKVTKTGELINDLKKALEEVAKELPLSKKKKEDQVADRTPEEVKKGQKEATETMKKIEKEVKKYTEKEAYGLSKKEQIVLLGKLGSKVIPKLERGRVNLILELEQKA